MLRALHPFKGSVSALHLNHLGEIASGYILTVSHSAIKRVSIGLNYCVELLDLWWSYPLSAKDSFIKDSVCQ